MVRPLVLFTLVCKDYGISPYLAASPLNPPPFAADPANGAIKIFKHEDLVDAIVLRPSNVYRLSLSFYGLFFKEAEEAKKGVCGK